MSLVRNTLVQSGLTLFSRVLGFGRDVVLAAKIGAGPVGDAFFAALMFPNLFRRFFAEGAFAQAFVPSYARTLEAEGPEAAEKVAGEAMRVLFAVTAGITIIAQLAMPWIMIIFMGAYLDQPDIFNLAVLLTQITMPYLTCMALAALLGGVLNSSGRFALTAGAPTLLNVCIIAAALLAGDKTETARFAAIAVTLAGVLQAALLFWGVSRQGVKLSLIGVPKLTPNVKRIMGLAVPGAIAASGMQINVLISQALAGLETGARSWLQYADRLYQLPLGLVGVAVAVAILPRLSRAARSDDGPGAQKLMDDGVALAMALTIPAAAALLIVPNFLLDGLFARGAFTGEDARLAASALIHFAWGVPAFVLIKVLAPAFFAREDTKTPMRYALVSVVVNIIIGSALFFGLKQMGQPGFPGLAIATSIAAWANAGLLALTLHRRGIYTPGPVLLGRLIRVALAVAVMSALVWYLSGPWRVELLALVGGSRLLGVVALIGAGGVAYGVAALLFGAVRVRELAGAFRRS